jgi:hypothetical protein
LKSGRGKNTDGWREVSLLTYWAIAHTSLNSCLLPTQSREKVERYATWPPSVAALFTGSITVADVYVICDKYQSVGWNIMVVCVTVACATIYIFETSFHQ